MTNWIMSSWPLAIYVVILSAIIVYVPFQTEERLQVQLPFGIVEESSQNYRSYDSGQTIHSFLGIRYGKAPRFQRPRPSQPDFPSDGNFQAENFVECVQPDVFSLFGGFTGQEDCLHLNVYTKNITQVRPVLVWIHGGGFVTGSGSAALYGPDYFMERDLILVTVNYRLGALGFLGMGDDTLPGNLGLWDIKLALEWIQEHIQAFGGDPKRVTVMGQSAGGLLAFFSIVSPQTNHLFHKAIVQSGIGTVPYPKSDKHPAYYARTLALELGCDPNGTSETIRDCLKDVDPRVLNSLAAGLFKQYLFLPNPYKPHLDNGTSDPFFPRDPLEMMERGEFQRIPTIYGYNEFDNLLFTAQYRREFELFEDTKARWEEIASSFMFQRERDEITAEDRQVSNFYLERVLGSRFPQSFAEIDPLTKYFTLMYGLPGFLGVTTMAKYNQDVPVFSYIYSHHGSFSLTDIIGLNIMEMLWKILGQWMGYHWSDLKKGASHTDEVFLQFRGHSIPFEARLKPEDHATSRLLVNLWANFVESGDPNQGSLDSHHAWPSYDFDRLQYANITNGMLLVQDAHEFEAEILVWNNITNSKPHRLHHYTSNSWGDLSLFRSKNAHSP